MKPDDILNAIIYITDSVEDIIWFHLVALLP